jgi:hypothetical protein
LENVRGHLSRLAHRRSSYFLQYSLGQPIGIGLQENIFNSPDWYNPLMANVFILQMVGLVLAIAGFIALTASAHLFGTPMSQAERRRASDEWNRRRDLYRLPVNLESIVSAIFFLGGIGILIWSNFEYCAFLAHWFPPLPEMAKQLLSCR